MLRLSLILIAVPTLIYWTSTKLVDGSSGIVTNKNILENLIYTEHSVVDLLQNYVNWEREKIDVIQRYIENYEKNIKDQAEDISEYLKNPLQSYIAIKHFTKEWLTTSKYITYQISEAEHLMQNITDLRYYYETFETDSLDDILESASNLVKLQITYNLSLPDFASGRLKASNEHFPYESIANFDGYDCVLMGLSSAHHGYKNIAFDWLNIAKLRISRGDNSTNDKIIRTEKNFIQTMGPESEHLEDGIRERLQIFPNRKLYSNYRSNQSSYPYQALEDEMFMRLCRGENFSRYRISERKNVLKCQLMTSGDHWLLLQPFKTEFVSNDPKILFIHDFVGDGEIEALKNKSEEEEVQISMVTDRGDGGYVGRVERDARISVNFWMSDADNILIRKLSRRIEAFTGLPASDINGKAEMYQIANYPIGGRYISHHDYFCDSQRTIGEDTECGDRILTLMMYLNDVEVGGATVFTDLGIRIKPKKGAALLWWNLDKKGTGDERTYHGGCPVLYGTKWIANKWICYNSATFLKPCGKDENEFF